MNKNLDSSISRIFEKSPNILSRQWLKKTEEFSGKIFFSTSNESNINQYISLIKDPNGVFDKLIKTVNQTNRITYCKAIFNYCEMSQDWRVVGMWLMQEITQLEIETNKDHEKNLAWLYFAYGRYLEETGKFNKSFDFHQRGIEVSQKHNDLLNLSLNKLGIGIALQRFTDIKDIQKAANYLIEAIEFFKESNPYQQSNSLLNLGSCYDRLGKADKAIESYRASISILEEMKNQFDLGRAYYSLGIAHLNNDQFQEALETFTQGEKCCEETKNLYFLSHIYYGFGWLEYRNNRFRESQEFLEKSIRSFNSYKEEYFGASQSSFYESEGNFYLLASASYCRTVPIDKNLVKKYLDRAESAYKQLEHPDKKLAQVLANRARLYEYIKEYEIAIDLFYQLFYKGKQLKQISIMSDAAIHLVRIHRQEFSALSWFMVAIKLNFLGCWSLLLGSLQRQKRTQKVIQHLKKTENQ